MNDYAFSSFWGQVRQAVSNVMLAVAKLHSKGVGIQSLAGFLTVLEQRIEDVTPYMTAEGVSNMMGVMATLSADAAAFKASVDSLPVLHFRMSQVKSQMKAWFVFLLEIDSVPTN